MAALWRVIRRILKWTGIAVLGLVGLVVVLLAMALAINARDEPLSEQAKSLLVPPPNPYSSEDNIYVALAGFDAPAGESVTATGQSKIEEYNKRLAASERDPHWEASYTLLTQERPGSLQFKGEIDFTPQPLKSYWNEIPAHRAELDRLMADNRELFQRYGDLHRRHGYFEITNPSPLAPGYFPGSGTRTLFLADAVLRLRSADARLQSQALRDLRDDVQLWRAVLTGEGATTSKMVAINCIHSDEMVLADIIADPQALLPSASNDADAIAPVFAPQEWNIGATFFSEFRVHAQMLQQLLLLNRAAVPGARACGGVLTWLCQIWDKVGEQFFKFNATENLYASQAFRLARESVLGSMRSGFIDTDESLVSLRSVYNPFGRVLVGLLAPVYRQYTWRAWDGAAFQRLVRLGYEIRRQRIDTEAIPAFLKQHPEWATHPGDGRPFLWDPAKRQISVQPMVKPSGSRSFSVHIWKAPPGA